MGQKSSKKTDLFITDDVTLCELPDEDVSKFVGRAREYTAVDVHVDAQNSKGDDCYHCNVFLTYNNSNQSIRNVCFLSPIKTDTVFLCSLLFTFILRLYKLMFNCVWI